MTKTLGTVNAKKTREGGGVITPPSWTSKRLRGGAFSTQKAVQGSLKAGIQRPPRDSNKHGLHCELSAWLKGH